MQVNDIIGYLFILVGMMVGIKMSGISLFNKSEAKLITKSKIERACLYSALFAAIGIIIILC